MKSNAGHRCDPGIVYSTLPPDKTEFFKLFETTGWNASYRLTEEELVQAVRNSWHTVSAYDGPRLVGFGRTLCDGIVHALILDMIVVPEYRLKGIGSEILRRLLEHCRSAGIRDIQLFCAKGKSGFYEKNGFTQRPGDAPGMEIKWRPVP